MLSNPKPGTAVQVWYRPSVARWARLHGRTGVVVIRATGKKPKNHGVEIDGMLYVVPGGNLRLPPDAAGKAHVAGEDAVHPFDDPGIN